MRIAQLLVASSFAVVETAGLHFRIRRITSETLVAAGAGFLVAARQTAAPESGGSVDPRVMRDGVRFQAAVVAAGVVSVSVDGAEWQDDFRIVVDPAQESAEHNRVAPASLPPGVVDALYAAIMKLSTGREAPPDWRETFRRAGPVVAPSSGGGVPHDADGGAPLVPVGAGAASGVPGRGGRGNSAQDRPNQRAR